MKNFIADYVFPVHADPIKNGVVTVDDDGKIVAISNEINASNSNNLQQLSGVLCPGFINAHCHLELSHLKGQIKQRTGLIEFIKSIQSLRGSEEVLIKEAAENADADMYNNGIVAVGDISNTDISLKIKQSSKLYYHTFVETFAFLPEKAQATFEHALDLAKKFKPLSVSVTPHAPYSVSKELFKLIRQHSEYDTNLISMHNQECEDENRFYRYKLGQFLELYQYFNIDISYFKPQARNSVQSVIPLLTDKQKILLVHNTCTNLKDIYFIKRFDRQINWCFCPNANLYIENKLPKIDLFTDQGFNITLGTDSLASNDKLCILSEMRTLQEKFPSLSLERLVKWGTHNGAKFLGIDEQFGTLEVGKKPGLNLIENLDGLKITPQTTVRRLA